jgi:hypothetical protein
MYTLLGYVLEEEGAISILDTAQYPGDRYCVSETQHPPPAQHNSILRHPLTMSFSAKVDHDELHNLQDHLHVYDGIHFISVDN